MTGTLIKTDGTESLIEPANHKTFVLKELQGLVGGYIEIIDLPDKRIMVLNEEGKLNGLPKNERATTLAAGSIQDHDYIAGDTVVCRRQMVR